MTIPILHLGIFVSMAILYIVSPSSQNGFVSLFYTAVTFMPAIAGMYALRFTGIGNAFGKSILLVTIGIWSWTIAECIWYVFNFVLYIDPYPSLADVFFLLSYPIFFAGILLSFKSFGVNLSKVPMRLLLADLLMAVVLSSLVLYFGVYKVYDSETSTLQNVLSITYGVVDLALVVTSLLVVSMVREFSRSRFGFFWIIITAGLVLFLIADVLFSIFTDQHSGDLKPFTYIDLLWIGGYLLFSYALLDIALFLKKMRISMHKEISEEEA